MILFSQLKVEQFLASGEFSEWEKVKYFLFSPIITAFLGGPIFLIKPRYGIQSPTLNSVATLIGGILIAVVTYFGVRQLYRTNLTIDGKNFIERCTILSVPIFLKFTILATPIFILFLFLMVAFTSDSSEKREYAPIFMNIIFPALMAWYYSLLNRSFYRTGKVLNES